MKRGRFSGKKNLKALIDGHLGLIRLHLAEVGIQGQIDRERISQDDLGIKAQAAVVIDAELRAGGISRVQEVRVGEDAIGDELQIMPRRDPVEPLQGCHLVDEALDPVRDVRPKREVVAIGWARGNECPAPNRATALRRRSSACRSRGGLDSIGSIATSLLERAGFKQVMNVVGGFDAWLAQKLPFSPEERAA